MDGENNGKPYFLIDDLGGKPPIFGNTQYLVTGNGYSQKVGEATSSIFFIFMCLQFF